MPIPLTQLINTLLADDQTKKSVAGNDLDPSGSFTTRANPTDMISGGNVLIWVGPPLEIQAKQYPKYLYPVGTCTSIALQEARSWLSTSEFGEQHYYRLPGKMQITMNISRVQTAMGDFYRTFYQWLQVHWTELGYKAITWSETPSLEDGTRIDAENTASVGTFGNINFASSTQVKNPSSELLFMPFGLLMAQYDQSYNIIKKQYAENCRILNRADSMSPQSPFVEENGQISPFKVVPTTIQIGFKEKMAYKFPTDSKTP